MPRKMIGIGGCFFSTAAPRHRPTVCKNIGVCAIPHSSVSSRAVVAYGDTHIISRARTLFLPRSVSGVGIYAAQPLSRYKRGNIQNYKVNFASQKRSFTCLAPLGVQDDRLVGAPKRRHQGTALRVCGNSM